MDVHKTVKSSYLALDDAVANNPLRDVKWFLEQEANTWDSWVSLPMADRLQLWRDGFTSPCGKLYDFETYGRDAYISELQKNRLYRNANGSHRYLLDDKLSQHWMLSEYPEHRPTAFGLLGGGHVHGTANTVFEGDAEPIGTWLPSKLREEGRLVLKHLRGKGGKEVVVLEDGDRGFTLDGRSVTEAELIAAIEPLSNYLVTEFVDQHDYADDLYPHASNTIRLLTIWDEHREELFMPVGIHRIGTERSQPIDNFSAGGLSVGLDLETGELQHAVQYPFSGTVSWYNSHPDTGADILGETIPHWETVRETVERIARDSTNIPIIGWDILLDRSGEPVILEANTGTSLDLLQVHEPLLTDPDIARVVARYLPEVDSEGYDSSP